MTNLETLIELGFKENNALIYLAALEIGECSVGRLVKKTGLHKQLIYNSALSLQNAGYLNIAESEKQRVFIPLPPTRIVEKEKNNLKKAEKLAKELKTIASTVKPAENIRIYKGIAGIRQYYLELIEKMPRNSFLKIIGVDSKRYFEIFPLDGEDFKNFEEMRVGKRIQIELIIFGNKEVELQLNKGRRFMEIKLLNDQFSSPNDVIVGGSKVGLLFFSKEPYLLELPGVDLTEGFTEYFKFFWKRGESCYKF